MKTNWIGFADMGVVVFFMTGSALAQPVCNLDMESLVTSTNGSSVQGYAHLCADAGGVQIELVGSGRRRETSTRLGSCTSTNPRRARRNPAPAPISRLTIPRRLFAV